MPVNTAALKTFAPAMRRQLLEAVGRKLDRLLPCRMTQNCLRTTQAKKVFRPQLQTASLPSQSLKGVHQEKQFLPKPPSRGLAYQRARPKKHRLASGP